MPRREQKNASSSSGRKESQNPKAQASGYQLTSTLTEDDDTTQLADSGRRPEFESVNKGEGQSQKDGLKF